MNFNGFLKFSKDFQIFPDLIPKAKLLRIFYSLSLLFSSPMYDEKLCKLRNNLYKISKASLSVFNQNIENIQANVEAKMKEEGMTDMIDSMLFVQGLALCALEIYFSDPQPSELEKVNIIYQFIM